MHIGFISYKYFTKYHKFVEAVHFVCVCVCVYVVENEPMIHVYKHRYIKRNR